MTSTTSGRYRNASTSELASRNRIRAVRDSTISRRSQRRERAEASSHEQVRGPDRDREDRVRRREWWVAERRVVVDDVADELRIGDEVRCDVVPERQGEREDRPCD